MRLSIMLQVLHYTTTI